MTSTVYETKNYIAGINCRTAQFFFLCPTEDKFNNSSPFLLQEQIGVCYFYVPVFLDFFCSTIIRYGTDKYSMFCLFLYFLFSDPDDDDQKREFLEEIEMMKSVGYHRNIVNLIGCCTVTEPLCLIQEFVPCGDLLHYLRARRATVRIFQACLVSFWRLCFLTKNMQINIRPVQN